MSAWHLEIRSDADGRTLTQVDVEARKLDEIEAVRSEDSVGILLKGETLVVGYMTTEQAKSDVSLHRWPIDKSAEPQVTPIKR